MEELQRQINELGAKVDSIQNPLSNIVTPSIATDQADIKNIVGMFRTITDATELSNATARQANTVYEQIFIDTTTATKKLYIYDYVGKVWRSCTIA